MYVGDCARDSSQVNDRRRIVAARNSASWGFPVRSFLVCLPKLLGKYCCDRKFELRVKRGFQAPAPVLRYDRLSKPSRRNSSSLKERVRVLYGMGSQSQIQQFVDVIREPVSVEVTKAPSKGRGRA